MTHDHPYLSHITYMDERVHLPNYIEHGALQMPLFDVNDPDVTWKTTDSWKDEIEALDAKRAEHLGQS